MRKSKIEKDFMIDDYRCVVLGTPMGHRCGYVGLPQEHKFNNVDYDEIDVDVHGGLTYADNSTRYPVEDSRWWIGFDCGHYGDGKDFELVKELNDKRTYDIMVDIERSFHTDEKAKTTEYVENQLIELVNQLKDK